MEKVKQVCLVVLGLAMVFVWLRYDAILSSFGVFL